GPRRVFLNRGSQVRVLPGTPPSFTLTYDKSRKISVSDRLFEAARSGLEQDQREDQCCRRIDNPQPRCRRQARAGRLAGPSMASCPIRAQRGKESGSKPGAARTRLDAIGTAGELLRYSSAGNVHRWRSRRMQAVCCREWGPPDVLRLENVARRELAPSEVRIRVHAVGVNFA